MHFSNINNDGGKDRDVSSPVDKWNDWVGSADHSIILDGGLGELVSKRGNDILPGSLWSGQLIKSNPGELKQVAKEWLKAGAEIICTATYQVTTEVLASEFKMPVHEAEQDIQRHCQDICETVDQYCASQPPLSGRRKPLVALSLGPLAAISPDFNEFSSDYGDKVSSEELGQFQRGRVDSFLGAGHSVGVAAFETVGASLEAVSIVKMMESHPSGLPYWLSFQCRDDTVLANGETLADTIPLVLSTAAKAAEQGKQPRLVAIGINCVCVTLIKRLAKTVADHLHRFMKSGTKSPWDVRVIAYPNSGEVWSERSWVWAGGDDARIQGPLLEDAWASVVTSSAANIVGGCCRTGPSHIAALCKAVGCDSTSEIDHQVQTGA